MSSGERWTVLYPGFDPEDEGLREALATLGNGLFATRGAFASEPAGGVHYPGTYVAGLYNRRTTEIAGREVDNEDLVNVPNWLPLTFRANEAGWFTLAESALLDHQLEIDLRRGLTTRSARVRDAHGQVTHLTERRLVHMADPHLAALETTLTPQGWSGRLVVRSGLDGNVVNAGVERYRQLAGDHLDLVRSGEVDPETVHLLVQTNQSLVYLAEAARTRVIRGGRVVDVERGFTALDGFVAHDLAIEVDDGEAVTVEKVVSLYTARSPAISEAGLAARQRVARAPGFDELLDRQQIAWDRLWRRCHIALRGNPRPELILRLHIFHLLQTVSENTIGLDVGVPARGLHGEAYRGHVFWDELFIFPFLNLRYPDLTRSLLLYRYRRLEEARHAAREAGYEGAMFPWQSGSDGREETQVVHLNPLSGRWSPDGSHRQRHINIAIAYNVWQYYEVTGDLDFLDGYGAELLVEIARFWASIAVHDPVSDRFEIHGVMGPDEYHERYPDAPEGEGGLRNNAYTNLMAVWVLCRALDCLARLPDHRREELTRALSIGEGELERWETISRRMRVVFHDDGIISQFEGYDELEEFDWDGYRERYGNIHRLDRILEAEGDTTDRYKVSKQADVLMLFYLLSAEELAELFDRLGYGLDEEAIPRNIVYYLERTSHGSTLSGVVHAWVLSRSDRARSWEFFCDALESDVADVQGGTTKEGIHLGAMAGTVDIAQRCYSGLETRADVLWFNPRLPDELPELDFEVHYRGQWVAVEIDHKELRVRTRRGPAAAVKVGVGDEVVELEPGTSARFHL